MVIDLAALKHLAELGERALPLRKLLLLIVEHTQISERGKIHLWHSVTVSHCARSLLAMDTHGEAFPKERNPGDPRTTDAARPPAGSRDGAHSREHEGCPP